MVADDIEPSDAIVPENWYMLHKLIGTKTEAHLVKIQTHRQEEQMKKIKNHSIIHYKKIRSTRSNIQTLRAQKTKAQT